MWSEGLLNCTDILFVLFCFFLTVAQEVYYSCLKTITAALVSWESSSCFSCLASGRFLSKFLNGFGCLEYSFCRMAHEHSADPGSFEDVVSIDVQWSCRYDVCSVNIALKLAFQMFSYFWKMLFQVYIPGFGS